MGFNLEFRGLKDLHFAYANAGKSASQKFIVCI
jgi:hypothetical protein